MAERVKVYLVKKDKLMLSESRFIGDSTILQLEVDTLSVKEALCFGEGGKLQKLQFVIVATHSESLNKALDIILAQDVGLGSIRFMYNPSAMSANVLLAAPGYDPNVQWNGNNMVFESARQTVDLGNLVKKNIHYDA